MCRFRKVKRLRAAQSGDESKKLTLFSLSELLILSVRPIPTNRLEGRYCARPCITCSGFVRNFCLLSCPTGARR